MALTLPSTPPARPGDPAVTAALAVGVRLDDPFPQLYRDDRAADEVLRVLTDAIRAGLLALDETVDTLTDAVAGVGTGGQGSAAVQAQIQSAVAALVGSTPAALDTLAELATALGNDPNFAATLNDRLAQKYARPGTGIPKSDLASDVQDLLDRPGGTGGITQTQLEEAITTRYAKPTSGIPLADIDPAVRTTLKGDPGQDGLGIEILGDVATYASLPTSLGAGGKGAAYVVVADGLLYVWSGTAWPAIGQGFIFRGPAGADGAAGLSGTATPGSVGVVTLDAALASRVKVPQFVPQDQTTLLGLPVVYLRDTSPTITKASTGLPSIYWPYLVRVPDDEFVRLPQYGRWRLYCSTDHDTGAGGIACLKTDADRPGDPGTVWTAVRPAGVAILFKRAGGDQVETPTVIYNPLAATAQDRWRLYYQIVRPQINGITPQRTEVANSPDGITGWTVIPGAGMPNPNQDWLGWRHTGYARVWLIDGQWVSWHLSGGGDQSTYGWSYSNDGLTWVMDRRRILTAGAWGGPLSRLGVSSLFKYRGALWGLGRVSGYTSGITASPTELQWMNPMRPDLLGPAGRLQAVATVADPGVTSGAFGPSFAAAADGSLWCAYRTGDENSSFRFMEVK